MDLASGSANEIPLNEQKCRGVDLYLLRKILDAIESTEHIGLPTATRAKPITCCSRRHMVDTGCQLSGGNQIVICAP